MSARHLPGRADEASDIHDLAEESCRVLGSGRGARLDPDALASLAAATMALGTDSVTAYRARGLAATSDTEMLDEVEEIEHAVAATVQEAVSLAQEAQRELAAAKAAERRARADLRAARAQLAAAEAMPVDPKKCDGCHAARAAAIRAAKAAIAAAQAALDEALGDQDACEEALEILRELIGQLQQALACLRRVSDDLESVYEPVYDHVRGGGVMPRDGDWLTGEDRRAPAAAPAEEGYPCTGCSGSGMSRLVPTAVCDRCGGRRTDPYAMR